MPEAEFQVVAPPAGQVASSDCWWEDATGVNKAGTFDSSLRIGQVGKNDGAHAFASIYQPSMIPLGSTVLKGKLSVKCRAFDSQGTNTSEIWAFASSERALNRTITEYAQPKCSIEVEVLEGAAQLGQSPIGTSASTQIRADFNVTGVGSAVVIDSPGSIDTIKVVLAQFGSPAGDVFLEVYGASGSAGGYTRGSLLRTSSTKLCSSLGTSKAIETFTITALPVLVGEAYIVIVTTDPIPGTGTTVLVYGTGYSGAQKDENALFVNTHVGFRRNAYWGANEHLQGIAFTATAASVPSIPTLSVGNVYTFGDSGYSPNVVATDFSIMLQEAIDQRTDVLDYIGLRWGLTGDNTVKQWESSRSATETINGLYGAVLTIDYAPNIGDIRARLEVDPMVSSRVALKQNVSGTQALSEMVSAKQEVDPMVESKQELDELVSGRLDLGTED